MSDLFYSSVRLLGRHAFWVSSDCVVRGTEHTASKGRFLITANHQSPFDVPLIIRHAKRHIDFVSITEVFQKPLVGRFYGAMNAFPLDRSTRDLKTIRIIIDRLEQERAVAMFPEGELRPPSRSIVAGKNWRSGFGRIAMLTHTPIIPCAIVNSAAYARPASWLPIKKTRYAIAFGAPINPPAPSEPVADKLAAREIEEHACKAIRSMHAELSAELVARDAPG